jgi:hypothetical protein
MQRHDNQSSLQSRVKTVFGKKRQSRKAPNGKAQKPKGKAQKPKGKAQKTDIPFVRPPHIDPECKTMLRAIPAI